MSAARRSWLTVGATTALVLSVLATALVVTDHRTPHERAAITALEPVAERPDGHVGVVVLGTSLSRNALSTHEELSAALSAAGLGEVVATNLGMSAASVESFGEVLGHVWAASPDILVIEPGIFLGRPFEPDRSLRTRITRWFESAEPPNINAPRCRPRSDELLAQRLERHEPLLAADAAALERLRAFLSEASTHVDRIVWVVPPRSAVWSDAVDGRDLEVRRRLLDAAADLGVAPVVPIEPPPIDHYCDFSHLDLDAARRFLETWATATAEEIGAA